ncbi:MAG: PHP domain-containing protein [Arachnia sp.]
MRIDLHTHSRVSDGTDTPTGLVVKAAAAGLDVIALTDHDTFAGVPEALEAAKRVGLRVVGGAEISTQLDGYPVHLLAYGCDPHHRRLNAELARIRSARSERLPRMCALLTELGLPVTLAQVQESAGAAAALGRPHVADTLVRLGYVKNRSEAFDRYLDDDGPAFVRRYAPELSETIDLVHAAGGVAVIAHPWGRRGAEVLTAQRLEALRRDHRLDGIEVDHEDHDAAARSLLFELGARLGLVRTGASDYHGLGKPGHELGCNLTRPSAFADLLAKIRQRGGHP